MKGGSVWYKMKKVLLKVLNISKYVIFVIMLIILEVDSVFKYIVEDIFHIPSDIAYLLMIPIAVLMIFLIIRKSNKNKIISKSNKKTVDTRDGFSSPKPDK